MYQNPNIANTPPPQPVAPHVGAPVLGPPIGPPAIQPVYNPIYPGVVPPKQSNEIMINQPPLYNPPRVNRRRCIAGIISSTATILIVIIVAIIIIRNKFGK